MSGNNEGIIQKIISHKLMIIEQQIHANINNADAIHTLEYHGQQLIKLQQELIKQVRDTIGFSCQHSKGVCVDCFFLAVKLTGEQNAK